MSAQLGEIQFIVEVGMSRDVVGLFCEGTFLCESISKLKLLQVNKPSCTFVSLMALCFPCVYLKES